MLYRFNHVVGLLNNAKNSSTFEQVCAVNTVGHIIAAWIAEKETNDSFANSIHGEIKRISRMVEDSQVPPHVKCYLIECIVNRLHIINDHFKE